MGAFDPRLKKLLEAAQFKYKFDEDGDAQLTFGFGDGRSQLVIVKSETAKFGNYEGRDIDSPIALVDSLPIKDLAVKLLQLSGTFKAGSISIKGGYLVFTLHIPAEADLEVFKVALSMASGVADDLEQKITGGKDLY